jgi:patatin-like phospholipase/acyl hydrolase
MSIKVLTLDGGGSKGIYTIGVLKELEKNLGQNIGDYFDYIYGTSTGSIICGLLAIGKSVEEVEKIYLKLIPTIMKESKAKKKSQKLLELGKELLGDLTFDNLKCDIGIIALNHETLEPLIFKSNISQSHGSKGSFIPGFGCELLTAILASSAAYPIFEPVIVKTKNRGDIKTVDGGFVANNPSLYATIDVSKKYDQSKIKILNIGTGKFLEKNDGIIPRIISWIPLTKFFFTEIYTASTNTNYRLLKLIYPNINIIRVNDSFMDIKTNMTESNINVLTKILKKGQYSYMNSEKEITALFKN